MDVYPDPALVGKAFVKQYYTQMHRDPAQMHRFYLDHSSFVHGGSEIGSEEPVIGQKAIHDKISSLDLQNVHAKIKQVDSHITLGNGIVVQVTGELSVSGQAMRAFVQTFVLAPEEPKKYYVHNDIFRYQDDDLVSESEANEAAGDGETPGIIEQVAIDSGDYPMVKEPGAVTDENIRGVYDSQSAELGDATEQGMQPSADVSSWSQYTETPPHHVVPNQNGLDSENTASPQEFPSASEPVDVIQDVDVGTTYCVPDESQEQSPTKVSTWASRIAPKLLPGSVINKPHNSKAISTSQALPQREQRSKRTESNSTRPPPQPSPMKDSSKKPATRESSDAYQIFVGGLPPDTTNAQLTDVFTAFGEVRDVRVNAKNFAFINFVTSDSVQAVMNCIDPIILHGKTLNIEAKRSSGPRSGGRGERDRDRTRGGGQGGSGRIRPGKVPSKR